MPPSVLGQKIVAAGDLFLVKLANGLSMTSLQLSRIKKNIDSKLEM